MIPQCEQKKEITKGLEFETNTFLNGKKVYGKIIDCGTLPNKTTKYVPLDVGEITVVDLNNCVTGHNLTYCFKNYFTNPYFGSSAGAAVYISQNKHIAIFASYDGSDFNCESTVFYTKN